MSGFAGNLMRLDKAISLAKNISRSTARSLIIRGDVRLNGVLVRDAAAHVDESSAIELAGSLMCAIEPGHQYMMYHKMLGEVCSREDAHHPLVFRHFEENRRHPLMTVGRLDQDTTGLLLLTTDGLWSHRVRRPGSHPKCYEVSLSESCSPSGAEEVMQQMRAGVILHNEVKPVCVRRMEQMTDRRFRLWIDEGRYHVVRRLWAALGFHVVGLHRVSVGMLNLDVEPGNWRSLSAAEIALF